MFTEESPLADVLYLDQQCFIKIPPHREAKETEGPLPLGRTQSYKVAAQKCTQRTTEIQTSAE